MMHKMILSHDVAGKTHELRVVDHPSGLVSIADDDSVRIFEPEAAIGLGVELILVAEPQLGRDGVIDLFGRKADVTTIR